jgi:hypothetical protein
VGALAFALEFRGTAGPVPGVPGLRRARTVAPSQALRTVLGGAGIAAAVESLEGDAAVLESEVRREPDGTFVESGTITYGALGRIHFSTIGRGHVGPAPVPGEQWGTVMWMVTGGDGGMSGARGLITSSFTVSADGIVVDAQYARLYLPG